MYSLDETVLETIRAKIDDSVLEMGVSGFQCRECTSCTGCEGCEGCTSCTACTGED